MYKLYRLVWFMLDFEFSCTKYTDKLGLCWILSSTVLIIPLSLVYVGCWVQVY